MILTVWVRNQGITDDMFKDGDIFEVWPDDYMPGESVKKRWLCVKVPDGPGVNWQDITTPEYGQSSGDDTPPYARMRKYRLNYAPKLTPEELAAAQDKDATVEVITDRFDLTDIVRK